MKEFIEKLIGRLEECLKQEKRNLYSYIEEGFGYSQCSDAFNDGETLGAFNAYSDMLDFIKELAEEYNNDWIPCSERLPNKSGKYLITQERYRLEDRLCNRPIAIEVDYVDFNAIDNSWNRARFFKVIAWQPLPQPYKENENGKI